MREDVVIAVHPDHLPTTPSHIPLASCEHMTWATGYPGTGLDAALRNVCNRLGGFEPHIKHRSDDGLVLGALVASGRAVALLPALLTAALPQVSARRLADERLQRTVFTATRSTTTEAPAVVAVRTALRHAAAAAATNRDDIDVTP